MVTAFGFFEPKEVLVEILLVGPGGAVDALQLGVPGIAAPIGARYTHQLESLAEIAKEGDRRAALPDLARNRLVTADDLAHPRLDPVEVFRRERLGTGEVVI